MDKEHEQLKHDVESLCERSHPQIVIALAALTMGWNIALEKPKKGHEDDLVEGLVVGTDNFIERHTPMEQ